VKALTEKLKIDPEKTREIQERTRERNLIIKEMKDKASMTVGELSAATGIERSKLLKHLIAMRQFGKVSVVGERDDQFAYGLPEEKKS
jgi:Mn-dependent DtxR family transcriptional regulator